MDAARNRSLPLGGVLACALLACTVLLCACETAPAGPAPASQPAPASHPAPAAESAPRSGAELFDGRSLAGWDGDPRFWSVEGGSIVGRSTRDVPCDETTYLVRKGVSVTDFEIAFDYRIEGGNSGLQFRSRETARWRVAGPQADIEDGPSWTGCLYEQEGRGVMATRGQRVRYDGTARSAVLLDDPGKLLARVHAKGWNHYVVRAAGRRIELEVNGTRMVEVLDAAAPPGALQGSFALQLHAGAPMRIEVRNLRLTELAEGDLGAAPLASTPPTQGAALALAPLAPGAMPQWIWAREHATEGEVAAFRRVFELPRAPARARLRGSADNALRLFVNGELALASDEWWNASEADVTRFVRQGTNTIDLVAENEGSYAGVWLDFLAEDAGGARILRIVSDASFASERIEDGAEFAAWKPSMFDEARRSAPWVAGALGTSPWGDGSSMRGVASSNAGLAPSSPEPEPDPLPASAIELPPGFRAELVYAVPKASQGSWVALANGPNGTIFTSDQYGALYVVTPAPRGAPPSATRVEKIDLAIGRSQGLCWAFDSLYVVVSEGGGNAVTGLHRLRDTDGDGRFDRDDLLRAFDGAGEHGPHAVVLGPDQKLYVIAGNFTHVPEPVASRVPRTWQEDELLPHLPDPNGHDPHILAPGGWLCRTNADGSEWELLTIGMRNAYDFAFGPDGEIFTFDSDMEWDIGAPWYRPTRILHLVSGADFGWRNGSSKWSASWPDTLPSVCDLGMTSPTGVLFGTAAKFPPKWKRAFFACDWAYGTIYAVHLDARGASFSGTSAVFARAKPFPVTDILIGGDGEMYVAVGGRRAQSALYRIGWTGGDEADPETEARAGRIAAAAAERAARRTLESLHTAPAAPDHGLIGQAVEALSSTDPFLRAAGRIALERLNLPIEIDPSSAAREIARLHQDGAAAAAPVIAWLRWIALADLDDAGLVDVLRVVQLLLLRAGPIEREIQAGLAARFLPELARRQGEARKDLLRVLAALDAAEVIEAGLLDLEQGATQEERIHAAHCLLAVRSGWTDALRQRQAAGLSALLKDAKGGASLVKFVAAIQGLACDAVPEARRGALGFAPAEAAASSAPDAPAALVHAWTRAEILAAVGGDLKARSHDAGAKAFEKARCATCHRVAGRGGDQGPDLTGAGSRFSRADLVESLLEPSKVISDQFRDLEVVTKEGDLHVGWIESEKDGVLVLRRLPPQADRIELSAGEIESRRPSPLSRMPTGAIDVLTQDELVDLFAFVLGESAPLKR